MAESTTLKALRRRVMEELGKKNAGFYHDSIDALATGSVTVADLLQGLDTYSMSGQDTIIFRPDAATAPDYYRRAGDLTSTTGLLAHTGANYADTTVTSESIEFWYHGVRADKDIHPAINRALEYVDFDTFMAVSHAGDTDADMFVSTDTDWTDVGTPTTSAKTTTARRTPYGVRSYNLINDAANEGTQSATIATDADTAGRNVKAFTIASTNVGTSSFRFYDVTGSASFDTAAVTTSEEEPQLMVQEWQSPPTDCKEMAVQMINTSASGDSFWNQLWIYKQGQNRINLPSYISEHFKAPVIYEARPRVNTGTGTWNAESLEFVPLRFNIDYFYVTAHNDANPHAIIMADGWNYEWPLFVQARLPYSAMGALTLDTDTTAAPVHLIVPRVKLELLNSVYAGVLPEAIHRRLVATALNERDRSATARTPTKAGPAKPYFAGVHRM